MNVIILLILIAFFIGGFFLLKKMKVGKEDWTKLKEKMKKDKITPEEKAFRNGEILLPLESGDFVEFDKFKEVLNNVKNEDKRKLLQSQIKTIDEDFEKWDPKERFVFEKEAKKNEMF